MTNLAVLDCGSNSTRLLIVDPVGRALEREMRITRLSAGVDSARNLAMDSMRRSFDVLSEYRTVMDEYHVTRGLLVATSAVRDATNGVNFLSRASAITGVEARILSGTEEALYSFAGATKDLDADPRSTVIVDIGGGSTELALRHARTVQGYSMQLGCVRVSERALGFGVVEAAARARAQSMIELEIDNAFVAVPEFARVRGDVRLVGLAGTVATLAQLAAGLDIYERQAVHHRLISRVTVQWWRDHLGAMTSSQRLEIPGMVPGREDVMVAGLFILDAVMERFATDELLSSEDDILDGVAASLI